MSRYPYGLSPDITPTSTPTKLTKAQKSRARREPSGVFSLFSPPQIQQFREAFSLIDHDGDGLVSEQDLKHIFASLGACLAFRGRATQARTHTWTCRHLALPLDALPANSCRGTNPYEHLALHHGHCISDTGAPRITRFP